MSETGLSGKVCLITGGASGIGRAMVRLFCEQGAQVLAVDLDAKLDEVTAPLRQEGHSVHSFIGDLSQVEVCKSAVAATLDHFGRIDVLCNNAGVLDLLTPLVDVSDELWERVINVNLRAPFALSRAAVPHMLAQKGGAIVMTCSASAHAGGRAGASYTASKHGLLGLMRSIAWYYGPKGVRCNAIAPGAIQTKMATAKAPHTEGFQRYQQYFPTIPPMGKAREVAHTAAFLASDAASYVNGAVINVDGGWTAY